MDNPRPEKVAVVDEVRQRLGSSSAAILTEYRGLAVQDLANLRRSLREAGGDYKVYKNTLVRFAVADRGLAELDAMLVGPTAIAFADDAVTVARALRDFARVHPGLVVKGGLLGDSVLSASGAGALADIPPRPVLLARLAGGLAAPLTQLAGLLQALPRGFAYGLKALVDKKAESEQDRPASAGPVAESPESAAPEPTAPEAAETETAAPDPTPDDQ